jgi:GNAT superfamily N-acetyltransferase
LTVEASYEWRGTFVNEEVGALHAEAFAAPSYPSEWDWQTLVVRHSLGWVTAREDDDLIGFVNVPWDGLVHAWLQDTMVAARARRQRVGAQLVSVARRGATAAGCQWLHVDFPDDLADFYVRTCGFTPTSGGLIALR